MKITVQASKSVKPASHSSGGDGPASTANAMPLSVFDKANYDEYVPGVFAFHAPAPPNAALEAGLAKALAEYREWAGRLVVGASGGGARAILLNDAGARFVEATSGAALGSVMPLEPSPEVMSLYPSCDGAEELMLVQVTRFACGSLVVGYNMHHLVADGRATCHCLLAWGQATRGVAIDPVPVHDRASFFAPRDLPQVEFEHRGAEFKRRHEKAGSGSNMDTGDDEVVVHRVHFSRQLISELKSRASVGAPRPCSTMQCVAAHLWRCITKARGVDGRKATRLHIAVDGRARMCWPRVPKGYTGNVVLWARPTTTAQELMDMSMRHVADLISREVARIDDAYFRSFIAFASSGVVAKEVLVPTTDTAEMMMSPNIEMDSLLGIPFYDLDFGGGRPFFFMPGYAYSPEDGVVYIVQSFMGDGSVDAYVSLCSRAMDIFKNCCYSLPPVPEARL